MAAKRLLLLCEACEVIPRDAITITTPYPTIGPTGNTNGLPRDAESMFVECAMHSAAQGDYRGQPISRARNPGIRLAVAGDWLALSISSQLLNTNQQDNSSSSQRTFVQVSNLFVLSWAEIIFPSPDPHPTPKATLARPPYPARSLTGWAVAWTLLATAADVLEFDAG
uniref:Uncharacterized protein n=1 Tax=Coccidioides posadasii RMSCC 3488 TaxID=454284 RepID=A0A0J6F249_COCPO|nr:hypothetical protein CPAG_00506 [Coccidioides posadasii RMSCC 3488]